MFGRGTDISKYFGESLRLRNNESTVYGHLPAHAVRVCLRAIDAQSGEATLSKCFDFLLIRILL